MILSKVLELKNKTQTNAQKILCKCDDCKKEWECYLGTYYSAIKQYGRDLCRGCKQKEQIKLGIRGIQYINAGKSAKILQTGKKIEERIGEERGKIFREKCSIANQGSNNSNFGGYWRGTNPAIDQKGKTLENIYGHEKAQIIKEKLSKKSAGRNNNMYGKPSPAGSGNGWSGWYKGWFFRSLKELSYMIYVIERFKLKWENGEQTKFKIEYQDWNNTDRTYRPDFFINDKFLVEIKPKNLWNSEGVKRKKEAAVKFCETKNLKYKLTECTKLISKKEIKQLIENKNLQFTKRYNEKWETLNSYASKD